VRPRGAEALLSLSSEFFIMATLRATWQFAENTGATFNEVYYVTASSISSPITSSTTKNLRLNLLHPLNTLLAIRFSDVDLPRSTRIVTYNQAGLSDGSGGPAVPGDAAVFKLSSSAGGVRSLWMRGFRDAWQTRSGTSGKDIPQPGLINGFNAWIKSMADDGYGLRKVTPSALPPSPLAPNRIISVAPNATRPNTADVTCVNPINLVANNRVIIGGASKKDLPSLNGRWSLLAVNGNTFTINYQTPQGSTVAGGNGHARQELFSAVNVFTPSACNFAYFGTRATKVPLTHSRGARRAARLRTSL
jgi:hypothetical protein